MAKDVPQHWKQFEEDGEEPTREKLNQGLFSSTRAIAAKGFLKHKQEERERREARQALQREETRDKLVRDQGKSSIWLSKWTLFVLIVGVLIALLAYLKR